MSASNRDAMIARLPPEVRIRAAVLGIRPGCRTCVKNANCPEQRRIASDREGWAAGTQTHLCLEYEIDLPT